MKETIADKAKDLALCKIIKRHRWWNEICEIDIQESMET